VCPPLSRFSVEIFFWRQPSRLRLPTSRYPSSDRFNGTAHGKELRSLVCSVLTPEHSSFPAHPHLCLCRQCHRLSRDGACNDECGGGYRSVEHCSGGGDQ